MHTILDTDNNVWYLTLVCLLFSFLPFRFFFLVVTHQMRINRFRYKPIIVFAAFMGMLLFGLLSWASKDLLVIAQASYGTFMACEIAYYTYIYAKVERSKYQLVTGHTRSAILVGRFAASVLSQLLISFGLMNYEELNYISFGCKTIRTHTHVVHNTYFSFILTLELRRFFFRFVFVHELFSQPHTLTHIIYISSFFFF